MLKIELRRSEGVGGGSSRSDNVLEYENNRTKHLPPFAAFLFSKSPSLPFFSSRVHSSQFTNASQTYMLPSRRECQASSASFLTSLHPLLQTSSYRARTTVSTCWVLEQPRPHAIRRLSNHVCSQLVLNPGRGRYSLTKSMTSYFTQLLRIPASIQTPAREMENTERYRRTNFVPSKAPLLKIHRYISRTEHLQTGGPDLSVFPTFLRTNRQQVASLPPDYRPSSSSFYRHPQAPR